MIQVTVQKNLIGLEDMLFGVGQVTQTRGKTPLQITKINAMNMPFDETQSLAERIAEMDDQYQYMMENRDLLMAAVEVITLLNALQVPISQLQAWLVNGNVLSPFQPYLQHVNGNHFLADGLNYTMLEDTIIDVGANITLGVGTNLIVVKGEDYV